MGLFLVGISVGLTMGLTGAGGALVALPLLMALTGVSLKEATVLSLLAVLLGTGVNLKKHFTSIDKRTALLFAGFSAPAALVSLPLKSMLPDLMITGLLILLSAYSILVVWRGPRPVQSHTVGPSFLTLSLIGLLLGVITTLTGLGGGVVLIPLLMQISGKTYEQVLPTSLGTVFFISLISFLVQVITTDQKFDLLGLFFMALGAIGALAILNALLKNIDRRKVETIRKIVFTLIATVSVAFVLTKTM